jgi:hypothetical protein
LSFGSSMTWMVWGTSPFFWETSICIHL